MKQASYLPEVTLGCVLFTPVPCGLREGFPAGLVGKEPTCNAGGTGSIPGLGRLLEEGVVTHSSILAWPFMADTPYWLAHPQFLDTGGGLGA